MQRDAVGTARPLVLRLQLPGDQHPVLTLRGRGGLEIDEELVHRGQEGRAIHEAVDVHGRDEVVREVEAELRDMRGVRQEAREDLGHAGETVALVRTGLVGRSQRQQPRRRSRVGRARPQDGDATVVGDDPAREIVPEPVRAGDLVGGDHRRRRVEHERRLGPRGDGHGDGVRAELRLAPEGRQDPRGSRGHDHADHPVLHCAHGRVGQHADVPTVAEAHHAHAGVAGLVDRGVHGAEAEREPQAPVGVPRCGARAVPKHADVRTRVHVAALDPRHIDGQHVGHAVALHPVEIRAHQPIGGHGRLGGSHAHGGQHGRGVGPQRVRRDEHGLREVDLERGFAAGGHGELLAADPRCWGSPARSRGVGKAGEHLGVECPEHEGVHA